MRALIISSTYYPEITKGLKQGAKNILKLRKISFKEKNVSGSYEIPFALKKYIKKYDLFIVLGCVIKGQTYNFDLISNVIINHVSRLSLDYDKPVGMGILFCKNKSQAIARSKVNSRLNRGTEAATAVINLLNI